MREVRNERDEREIGLSKGAIEEIKKVSEKAWGGKEERKEGEVREIKFRQRIKGKIKPQKDYWHYWGYIDGLFSGPIYTSKGKSYQYTGLREGKNRDGQEIYEGNTVRKHVRNCSLTREFMVRWDHKQCGFNISRGYNHWYEVIGDKVGAKK